MTVVFDSHGFVKRLTAAGMPEPQAEVLAREHTRWFDDVLATKTELATKDDLAPLVKTTDLDWRLKESELRLEARIEAMKSELIKWTFGAVGFQTLVMIGAVLALAKIFH